MKRKIKNPSRLHRMLFRSILKGFVITVAAIIIAIPVGGFIFYEFLTPSASDILAIQFPISSKIYSRDGTLLYEIYGEVKRDPISLANIPKQLQEATIAIEDKNFYQHGAISLKDIIRAGWIDYKNGDDRQGASTLTQQYIKNLVLTQKKSVYRKVVEAVLAHKLETRASKDQILEMYLNTIPYGRNAYGVQAASQEYFGKDPESLSLAESAYLVALPQASSFYNPDGPNRKDLDDRKNQVLKAMQDQGYITQREYDSASGEQVSFIKPKSTIIAPYFVFWVEQQLSQKYGQEALRTQGLQIYTTLDLRLQKIAEQDITDHADSNAKKYNAHNEALVAMDPKTGEVLAMVGGKDYFGPAEPPGCVAGKNCWFEPNVNVAASARQPGSSFKPYTYLTSFGSDFGYSPSSAIVDSPVTYGGTYSPQNYDGGYHGKVSFRKALAGSLNVPAVKVLNLVGIDSVVNMAHNLGITAPLEHCGLSLTLGSCEVKLVDHTSAYSAIANGGVVEGTCGILKMLDSGGHEIQSCPKLNKQVADPQSVYELTNIMTDNDSRAFIFGKNTPLEFKDRQVAAKTGTTDNWHDAWTMGFTPSITVGVWAGNNDGTLLRPGSDGIFAAAPIWRAFMDQALAGTPAEEFPRPSGVVDLKSKDILPQFRNSYVFTRKTDVFASFAIPKPKPKPVVIPKPVVPEPEVVNPNPIPEVHINITSPAAYSTIPAPYQVTVESSDDSQVAHIEIYIDGRFLGTLSSAPFVFNISEIPEPGIHLITAIATDTRGRVTTDNVSVSFESTSP